MRAVNLFFKRSLPEVGMAVAAVGVFVMMAGLLCVSILAEDWASHR